MNYYIGLDGGGTHTRAVLIDDELVVLGRGQAGASNHYVVGREQAAAHCAEAAAAALADALRIEPRLNPGDIVAWGFGLAGVRRTADAEAMRPHLDRAAAGLP